MSDVSHFLFDSYKRFNCVQTESSTCFMFLFTLLCSYVYSHRIYTFENTIEGRQRQIQEDGHCKSEINKSSASKTCLHTLQMKTQEAAFRQGWDTEVTYIYVAGMSSKVL